MKYVVFKRYNYTRCLINEIVFMCKKLVASYVVNGSCY